MEVLVSTTALPLGVTVQWHGKYGTGVVYVGVVTIPEATHLVVAADETPVRINEILWVDTAFPPLPVTDARPAPDQSSAGLVWSVRAASLALVA
jgi:hypothetical protein